MRQIRRGKPQNPLTRKNGDQIHDTETDYRKLHSLSSLHNRTHLKVMRHGRVDQPGQT